MTTDRRWNSAAATEVGLDQTKIVWSVDADGLVSVVNGKRSDIVVHGQRGNEGQEIAFAGSGAGKRPPIVLDQAADEVFEPKREQPGVAFPGRRHRVAFTPLKDADDAASTVASEVNVRRLLANGREDHCGGGVCVHLV